MKTNDKVYANLVQNLVRFGNKPRKPLSCKALLVQSLHGGEQQDIADGLRIRQQHAHSVDAKTYAARGGHAELFSRLRWPKPHIFGVIGGVSHSQQVACEACGLLFSSVIRADFRLILRQLTAILP